MITTSLLTATLKALVKTGDADELAWIQDCYAFRDFRLIIGKRVQPFSRYHRLEKGFGGISL